LYPKNKVSPFQESQMATLGGNVTAIRVAGTFDDCQRLVKTAFLDPDLSSLNLSSANSINIGRLLPQSFYYVWGYLSVVAQVGDPVVFSVPTGNVGNLTAGVIARRLGLPIARFIAATNANRTLPDYLESGDYRARPSIATLSNAMDVGDPSNFPRLLELHDGSIDEMRRRLVAVSISEDETRGTIRSVYERSGYVLDPHTAVAWAAANVVSGNDKGRPPVVVLATAHPAKFDAAIREAIGFAPPLPAGHAGWRERPIFAIDLDTPDYLPFKSLLRRSARETVS
jgi:threonine synthase